MKKVIAMVTAAVLCLSTFAGRGSDSSADSEKSKESNKLVVYSPNRYDKHNHTNV